MPRVLLAVPNVSEGADRSTLDQLVAATRPLHLLDLHSDPDHGRSVLTLAGEQFDLAPALARLAAKAAELTDITKHPGRHPHVGALDVAPVVYPETEQRGAACAAALTTAAMIGEDAQIPVFLYGQLATHKDHVERASIRAGGPAGLADRLNSKQTEPDYGPHDLHPRGGATLVTARPPLIAFNVDLRTDDVEVAKRIAARLRESGGGAPGVRAIGLSLPARGRAQVSFNVHDHRAAPLADLVEGVREEAPIAEAELVGLAPTAAFAGFPPDVPLRDFDPEKHLIEAALDSVRT
jgi:glutamate formiminotransferase